LLKKLREEGEDLEHAYLNQLVSLKFFILKHHLLVSLKDQQQLLNIKEDKEKKNFYN
jgi:hypothetical protein